MLSKMVDFVPDDADCEYIMAQLPPELESIFTRHDCLKFVSARRREGREAALEMMLKCGEWRPTDLPGVVPAMCPQNMLKVLAENNFVVNGFDTRHPAGGLVPHALYGEDLTGHPIYWVSLGGNIIDLVALVSKMSSF